jgi:WD40 repeat protein
VAGMSEGKVVIVDTVTGEKLLSLGGHDGDATLVLVTADGTRIMSGWEGDDGTVRVWDAERRLPRPRPAPCRHFRGTQIATRPL